MVGHEAPRTHPQAVVQLEVDELQQALVELQEGEHDLQGVGRRGGSKGAKGEGGKGGGNFGASLRSGNVVSREQQTLRWMGAKQGSACCMLIARGPQLKSLQPIASYCCGSCSRAHLVVHIRGQHLRQLVRHQPRDRVAGNLGLQGKGEGSTLDEEAARREAPGLATSAKGARGRKGAHGKRRMHRGVGARNEEDAP